MFSAFKKKITDFWYNCKFGFKNLWLYRNLIWNHRPWDFDHHILSTIKFQLTQLRHEMETGYEVRESLDLKLKDIDRALELLTHLIEDNYIDRVGGLSAEPTLEFVDIEGTDLYELKDTRTELQKAFDSTTIEKAWKLEQEEWSELWSIIDKGKYNEFGAQGWWE